MCAANLASVASSMCVLEVILSLKRYQGRPSLFNASSSVRSVSPENPGLVTAAATLLQHRPCMSCMSATGLTKVCNKPFSTSLGQA